MRYRLKPFRKLVRLLRGHLDGILPRTTSRPSHGAVEGMNNKIKSISHRSFGFRSARNFIAAINHCCARLPLVATEHYFHESYFATVSLLAAALSMARTSALGAGSCSRMVSSGPLTV